MAGKALYRKYRPTQLTNVVGQPQVTDALQNALEQGKVGHAYLFIGPRGTGKTSVARIFAHAVNDFAYEVEDDYLDIIEIDAASNTGVDNIRELREKAVIAPSKGKYKVYIIDEVHMLTKSASNALLKTLEEPPEHVIFILATTDAHKVPITISSRTQVFTFKLAAGDLMLSHLRQVADQEKIKITDEALELVVRRGGGSFRDSLSLLDQVATLSNQEITAELLSQALGLPQTQIITELLQNYASQNTLAIQAQLKTLLNTGIKPEIIASEMIEQIIEHPEPAHLPLLAKLPDVQPPFPEAKLLLALLNFQNPTPATTPSRPVLATNTQGSAPTTSSSRPVLAASPRPVAPSANRTSITNANTMTGPIAKPTEPTSDNNIPLEPSTAQPVSSSTTSDYAMSAEVFDWNNFIEAVRADSNAIFLQLQKVDHELQGDTLHIYPASKFTKGILEKSNHVQVMLQHLDGISILVHDLGDRQPPKDATLSQLSAIMGDIREVKTDSPFD